VANRIFLDGCAQHLWAGDLVWASDNIKMLGASAGYTPNTAAGGDQFLTAIAGGNIVCTSPNFTTKSNVSGVLKADNPVFTSVSGSTITQFVVYNDTGTGATSELLIEYDTASGGLPVVPNGGNITFQFAGSPNFVLGAAFAGLSTSEKQRLKQLWRRFRDSLVMDISPSGIWIPEPRIVQELP
jgi:hypothetical protein